jgi:phage antirepressor YoqD-like protein
METVKVERFVEVCGSQVAAAKKLGVKQNTLNNWLKRSPYEYEVTFTRDCEVLKLMKPVRR